MDDRMMARMAGRLEACKQAWQQTTNAHDHMLLADATLTEEQKWAASERNHKRHEATINRVATAWVNLQAARRGRGDAWAAFFAAEAAAEEAEARWGTV